MTKYNSRTRYINAFQEFLEEFQHETDRTAVILGAAKLDYILYQLLQRFLIPNASRTDELLDSDFPLSTFNAKINLCFRLGIIDAEFAHALHIIRRIRNHFIHEVSACQLDASSYKDHIRELVAPVVKSGLFQTMKNDVFAEKESIAGDFFAMLTIMAVQLDAYIEDIKTISTQNMITLNSPIGISLTQEEIEAAKRATKNNL